jgi:hypothetical protein
VDGGGSLAGVALGAANTLLRSQGASNAPTFAKLVNADVDAAAAIDWTKISKTSSSLADLGTKSAGALDSGNLASARLPTGSVSWAMSSITLAPTAGRLIINTSSGQDLFEGQVASVRQFLVTGSARFNWCDPATGTADTRLYRSAASVFTMDNAAGGAAKLHLLGEFECDGALNHDGTTVGFYGVTPTTRPAALTQTYSTTSTTHAAFTSADLGAFVGGATGFADAAERDGIRTQFNALRADVANVKQFMNQVVDYLQLNGIIQ